VEPVTDRVAGRLRRRGQGRRGRLPLDTRVTPGTVDAALRYRAVLELIEPLYRPDLRILEVGSGAIGVTGFLNFPVIGVDTAFERTDTGATPYLTRVEASADALPFESGSFDVVISVEMLEHIPASARPRVLGEMFRMLRPGGRMVVTFPADAAARELDLKLNAAYRKRYGVDHPWVAEHIAEGVPSTAETVELMRAIAGERGRVQAIKHDPARSWLLHQMLYGARRWYVPALLAGLHTRAGARLVFEYARRLDGGGHYRTILVADRLSVGDG
jgi:SAM-dependent methyltransferase